MHRNNGRAAVMTQASIHRPLREGGAIRPSQNRGLEERAKIRTPIRDGTFDEDNNTVEFVVDAHAARSRFRCLRQGPGRNSEHDVRPEGFE